MGAYRRHVVRLLAAVEMLGALAEFGDELAHLLVEQVEELRGEHRDLINEKHLRTQSRANRGPSERAREHVQRTIRAGERTIRASQRACE